jgi:hypothetical protein
MNCGDMRLFLSFLTPGSGGRLDSENKPFLVVFYTLLRLSIRDPVLFYACIRDPGEKNIRIRDINPRSYFPELSNKFLG